MAASKVILHHSPHHHAIIPPIMSAQLQTESEPLSMDFEYCPACANELDTGYECLTCGRDWRPWATVYLNVSESATEQ